MPSGKSIWSAAKAAGKDFGEDEALVRAAALAYYTALSIAPLLVLLLWIVGFLGEDTQARLVEQLEGVMGGSGGEGQAGSAVRQIVDNAEQGGGVAGPLSLLLLAISASSVFAQLQTSLNRIWDVRARPGGGVRTWIRKRLTSIGTVITLAFLLLVSLAASAVLSFMQGQAQGVLPGGAGLWMVLSTLVSFAVFVLVFALMYRYLPDVRIEWRDTWLGATLTAALFVVGKYLVGLYLGSKGLDSTYGAAGSLVALLIWVYYCAVIVFYGAEVTQVVAKRSGRHVEPDEHAVWVDAPAPGRA